MLLRFRIRAIFLYYKVARIHRRLLILDLCEAIYHVVSEIWDVIENKLKERKYPAIMFCVHSIPVTQNSCFEGGMNVVNNLRIHILNFVWYGFKCHRIHHVVLFFPSVEYEVVGKYFEFSIGPSCFMQIQV